MTLRKLPICPECNRTMRDHCAKGRCGWSFCGPCGLTLNPKTGRKISRDGK